MYVYIQSEPKLWTVGFYNPDSKWVAESDWDSLVEASQRVRYLNGGNIPEPPEMLASRGNFDDDD